MQTTVPQLNGSLLYTILQFNEHSVAINPVRVDKYVSLMFHFYFLSYYIKYHIIIIIYIYLLYFLNFIDCCCSILLLSARRVKLFSQTTHSQDINVATSHSLLLSDLSSGVLKATGSLGPSILQKVGGYCSCCIILSWG